MLLKTQKKKANSSSAVFNIFKTILLHDNEVDQEKEHFWVMGLNTQLMIKYIDLVSLGTLDASLVHPREVFRNAIVHGVHSIICAHNHPSGETLPSNCDDKVTQKLSEVGEIIGIRLVDHIIIGDGYYSYAENRRYL